MAAAAGARPTRSHPARNWLIAEWPKGKPAPTDYWISNLPASTKPGRLARLARLRWKIELDYRQLKGELGLDHYEGRSWPGRYHHTALVTAAYGFLTLERLRHLGPAYRLTLPQVDRLPQPIFKCWTGRCQTCQQPVDLDQLPLHHPRGLSSGRRLLLVGRLGGRRLVMVYHQ
jgi:hypothetical protein